MGQTQARFLSVGLTAFTLLVGCGHHAAHENNAENSVLLRRGLSGDLSSLDPAAAADTFSIQVLQDLYEGLTAESPTGAAIPGVASSWTIDPAGTRYTFHLRPDAHWSNGKPVRAQDFVVAWRRVLDPKQGSPAADELRLISGAGAIIAGQAAPETLGVTAPSDDVLIVNLSQPAAYLPQILAHSAAFPVFSDAAARTHSVAEWVSNGPYVLSKWQPGTSLELTRNPAYWDKANVHIPAVEYQITSDDGSQYARYRAGQIDLTDSVPANMLPALRAEHSSELVIAPFLATAYYGLNFSNKALGSSLPLRKALAMAVDRRQLVETLGFGQVGAYGFVAPGTWNYAPQSWQWTASSDADRIAEARRLYAQAGFTPQSPLHLRLLFNSNPVIRRTAILTAAMWKETLGVDTELGDEEYKVFLQSRHDKSRWDVARLGWNADFNDASNFLDTFRARSPNNDSGFENPSFDTLVDQAAATSDLGKRRQLLENAERVMLDDYPIVPLYFFVSKALVKPYVRGFKPSPLNHMPSKALSLVAH
jgi:oligopeptide transport system substrate-binding protein